MLRVARAEFVAATVARAAAHPAATTSTATTTSTACATCASFSAASAAVGAVAHEAEQHLRVLPQVLRAEERRRRAAQPDVDAAVLARPRRVEGRRRAAQRHNERAREARPRLGASAPQEALARREAEAAVACLVS